MTLSHYYFIIVSLDHLLCCCAEYCGILLLPLPQVECILFVCCHCHCSLLFANADTATWCCWRPVDCSYLNIFCCHSHHSLCWANGDTVRCCHCHQLIVVILIFVCYHCHRSLCFANPDTATWCLWLPVDCSYLKKQTQIYSVISLGHRVQRRPTLVNYGVHLTKWEGRVVVTCEGSNDWRVVRNLVVIVAISILRSLMIAGRSKSWDWELVLFSSSVSIAVGVGWCWGFVINTIALVIVTTASAMVDCS